MQSEMPESFRELCARAQVESVFRLRNASSQRTDAGHPIKKGAPIGAPDCPRYSPSEKPGDLCLKPGYCACPTTLVEDRSQQVSVRGKWSLSVALVVFSVVVSAFG